MVRMSFVVTKSTHRYFTLVDVILIIYMFLIIRYQPLYAMQIPPPGCLPQVFQPSCPIPLRETYRVD
jgi:hypothetical protein